jgi:hypothetical protein
MPHEITARAEVVTATPERYAKQLISHLGHKTQFSTDGATSTAEIAGGTATIVVGDGVIILTALAGDEETLERVTFILGNHLERFGSRNELAVTWVDDEGPRSMTSAAALEHEKPSYPG